MCLRKWFQWFHYKQTVRRVGLQSPSKVLEIVVDSPLYSLLSIVVLFEMFDAQ